MMQPLGGEVESFHVRAGLFQGTWRRQIDRGPRPGLRLLVVVLGGGAQEREQSLGHRGPLVRDDVVRRAPAAAMMVHNCSRTTAAARTARS
ncbi:hypothetical protein [Streptomyces sp. NPDC014744]|uniref:hypothetical protein n=1 Tax=Streptomyces sp. NPDC014744 TaxID=3364903 RepID=UPI0036F52E56